MYSKWLKYTQQEQHLSLESNLKPCETMKAFEQNNSFPLSFLMQKAGGLWHPIATKKAFQFQSI